MTEPNQRFPEVVDLLQITDHVERIKRANNIIESHQAVIADVSQVRRQAVEDLISAGKTQTDIAKATDMTRARVGQVLTSGPRPERAFLGSGNVITVAVGGKADESRSDGKKVPLASRDAMAAADKMRDLARSFGLKAEAVEVVAPPGHVNLNRPGLIVLCSPRLLPFVGQVLEADPHLGFGVEDDRWYLIDRETGHQYRSPSDTGDSVDYAYVGRLPRPDGRGTFLYLAGIHSYGTKGAAHFIESQLDELWKEARTRRFSVLIEARFDPKTEEITETAAITPIHKHEGIG